VERRVLVTGASSGIGMATALELARLGFRVIASARDPAKADDIEEAAEHEGLTVDTVVLDVTEPAGYECVVPSLGLWGLVNNAGYMEIGTLADVPVDDARRLFDTLVFAPARLVQLALPAMRQRGEGRIVNVISAAGHTTGPLLGWYGAAKHALAALGDALRPEVAGWGVDVIAVEPGGTDTAIWDSAAAQLDRRGPASRTPAAYRRAQEVISSLRPHMPGPEVVASTIGRALRSGRPHPVYRVGRDSALLAAGARFLPPPAKDRLLRAGLRL
jgi:short-subunit dehydrogenase